MFPEQVAEEVKGSKGYTKLEPVALTESGKLVNPSAHDTMARRINEAKEAMKIQIEKARWQQIARKKKERIDDGVACYYTAVKDLAHRYFHTSTHDFRREEYIALDWFLRKEVFKELAFHGFWNAISAFGLFSLAHLAYFSIQTSSDYFLSLSVIIGLFTQFFLNVKVYWDDVTDSEWRFLKYHFSFLWNRKYFFKSLEEKKEKQTKELV